MDTVKIVFFSGVVEAVGELVTHYVTDSGVVQVLGLFLVVERWLEDGSGEGCECEVGGGLKGGLGDGYRRVSGGIRVNNGAVT